MKIQQLPEELKQQLLTQVGDDEDSPNWEGEFTLESGRGANQNNYLIGQGVRTWVVSSALWTQLKEEEALRAEYEHDSYVEEQERQHNQSLDQQQEERDYLYDHPEEMRFI